MATSSSIVSLLSAFSDTFLCRLPPLTSNFNRYVSFPFYSSHTVVEICFQPPLVAVTSPQPCVDEPYLLDKSLILWRKHYPKRSYGPLLVFVFARSMSSRTRLASSNDSIC